MLKVSCFISYGPYKDLVALVYTINGEIVGAILVCVQANVVNKKEPGVGLSFNQQNYRRLQMKYNIEIINDMANQFAEIIKSAVIEEQRKNNPTPLIAQIENDMRTILLQVGQQALGMFLSSMQKNSRK